MNGGTREQYPSARSTAQPSWLVGEKVTIPEPVAGYLDRPELVERAISLERRLALLRAPGGFGKTTLLAARCRRLVADGMTTAWLSLDEQDAGPLLETYLVFAFHRAGVDVLGEAGGGDADAAGMGHRMGTLLQAIEAYAEPCVLALDELDRLVDPASIATLNFLFRRGPRNLRFAVACRAIPAGLEIVVPVLESEGAVLTADDLRFTRPEIAQFFDLQLSRRELTTLVAQSAGWPIALRVYRNGKTQGARGSAWAVSEMVENWLEAAFWRDLTAEDREFVLDLGLFDLIDEKLLADVLGVGDAQRRLKALPALTGLLVPVAGGRDGAWNLHPLIREHCARRRRREGPERYRSVHRSLAAALATRGETLAAMSHAMEAGDPVLTGGILEAAGGVRLWLREGPVALQSADRYLSADVLAGHPRLAFARCSALAISGNIAEARRIYDGAVQGKRTVDDAFEVDRQLAVGLLGLYGCESLGSERMMRLPADYARFAERADLETGVRAHLEYGLFLGHSFRGEFEAAEYRAERSRHCMTDNRRLLSYFEFQFGVIAMVQGRVEDAVAHYDRGRRLARSNLLRDPERAVVGDVLVRELALERNRSVRSDVPTLPKVFLGGVGRPMGACLSAAGLIGDLTLRIGGAEAAVKALEDVYGYAVREALPVLARYAAARRAGVLGAAGCAEDGERLWRIAQLPETPAACLDLEGLGWREMEALACARVRVLAAGGDVGAALALADELLALTEARGLRRTRMRALATALAVAHDAGDGAAAAGYLATYLRLYSETDYALGLVLERGAALAVLEGRRGALTDAEGAAVVALREALGPPTQEAGPVLTDREAEVLQRLGTLRDREIAEAIGLSLHGVRYHVRNLFAKLGVRGREEAVERARMLGIRLPAP